jgi:hypothetical protein
LDPARRWMGVSQWILAMICSFNLTAGEHAGDCVLDSERNRSVRISRPRYDPG